MKSIESLSEKELELLLDEKRASKNKSKVNKRSFSPLIVTTIVILNALFTMSILYLFKETGNEPTALIAAWFGFTTVELWSLAKIKRDKIKKESGEFEQNQLGSEIIE